MNEKIHTVLFLCTGNSARSIMAEALMNHLGAGRVRAYSAGSDPAGTVNPFAIDALRHMGVSAEGLRSKAWDELARPGASALDFVITVCNNAAGEACPVWPGKPITAHWGVPDPAAVEGPESEKWLAFRSTLAALENRIKDFVSLPLASIDHLQMKQYLDEIGRTR